MTSSNALHSSLVAGKYRLEQLIGRGGMGCVYRAVHEQLGQRVAIKTLRPELVQSAEGVARFLREARAVVKLRSEHVGRVIDVGSLESGAPYLVMEFLDGRDLEAELETRGPLPTQEAVGYALQACEALAEAHAIGIIHRDIKPANLFLTRAPDGSALVKVLDFGISKAAPGDVGFDLTRTETVMGSPGYMSPEQLRSTRDVDVRTDIWALGIVLFQLLVGSAPFTGQSFSEVCLSVAMDPTPPMLAPGLPEHLKAVVARCLSKDPAHRPANVAELAVALAPFTATGARSSQRIARVLSVAIDPTPSAAPATAVSKAPTTLSTAVGEPRLTKHRGRRSWAIAAAGFAVAASAALIITFATALTTGRLAEPTAIPAATQVSELAGAAPALLPSPLEATATQDPPTRAEPADAVAVETARTSADRERDAPPKWRRSARAKRKTRDPVKKPDLYEIRR